MKLKITYATHNRKYLNSHLFSFVHKDIELEAKRIFRHPCGSGAAAKRYFYEAELEAPADAQFKQSNGRIRVNINRKLNPQFKPKDFVWENNIAEVINKAG